MRSASSALSEVVDLGPKSASSSERVNQKPPRKERRLGVLLRWVSARLVKAED